MDMLDNKIKKILSQNIVEPITYEKAINEALYYKKKHKIKEYITKVIIMISSIIGALIGSFGIAYAVTGGNISEIPIFNSFGTKFIEQYKNYKQPVENQCIAYGETTIELTSTMCNEGITILEFDVKLSQEDYKNLKLDQTIYKESDDAEYEQRKEEVKKTVVNDVRHILWGKYQKEGNKELAKKFQLGNYDIDTDIKNTPEYEEYLEKQLKKINEQLEERKHTGYKIGLALNTEQVGGIQNYDKFNPNQEWYASIYIDDIPYCVNNYQKVEKINEYEYKVYTMYALTDDELNGKENFKISLKNNKLVNAVDWKSMQSYWSSNCQWFAKNLLQSIDEENKYIKDISFDFEVNVSKNEVLKDSKVIENPQIISEFRNITQTVEKVVDSPMQTIVQINHSASKQSSKAFANRYSDHNIEHLPLTSEYKVYDANGKELSCFRTSNKHTLIYSNGFREDYDPHDIPTKTYSNAVWETIEYLLIEKCDTDYIKIVPVESIINPVNDEQSYGGVYYEMDPLIINLK